MKFSKVKFPKFQLNQKSMDLIEYLTYFSLNLLVFKSV